MSPHRVSKFKRCLLRDGVKDEASIHFTVTTPLMSASCWIFKEPHSTAVDVRWLLHVLAHPMGVTLNKVQSLTEAHNSCGTKDRRSCFPGNRGCECSRVVVAHQRNRLRREADNVPWSAATLPVIPQFSGSHFHSVTLALLVCAGNFLSYLLFL